MLAELAIANAAFQVIKNTLSNGKELLDAGDAVSKYFKAENDIAKEVATKGKGSALEAYQAQQQLRKQEDELKYMLNKQGLLGYHNFLEFKAQFSRDAKEEAKLEARRRHAKHKAIQEGLAIASIVFSILFVIMGAAFGVAVYLK